MAPSMTTTTATLIATTILLVALAAQHHVLVNASSSPSSKTVVGPAKQRPNLLFMMADQLRWDAASYAGNKAIHTPGMDRLAVEGVRFKYSWSSTPTCTPARAAILTGQSPWNHGMIGYGAVAQRYPVEMPSLLSEAGYFTYAIGKDHFGWNNSARGGIRHGYQATQLYDGLGGWDPNASSHGWDGEFDEYDRWFARSMPGKDPQATIDGFDGDGWNSWIGRPYVYEEKYHPTLWVGQKAVEFINYYAESRPFFLKVSFHRPHSPYDPPQRVLDKVPASVLPPMAEGVGWDAVFKDVNAGCGPSNPDNWCGKMPENETVMSRRCYLASVLFVDEQVERIIEALDAKNLLENTWILWTADHGDGQGDHYHWRKGYPYEFSAHVPLLVRWPQSAVVSRGITLGRGVTIADKMTELRDVLHTFVDAAEATSLVPQGHFKAEDGKSLICLLQDPTGKHCPYHVNPGPWRSYIDMEHSTVYNATNHWNALTDGEIKYIFNANSATEQLFNLTADPLEHVELSKLHAHGATLKLWRQRMVQQFKREQRGPQWVNENKLMQRTRGQTYNQNFPHGPPASPGEGVVFEAGSGFSNHNWELGTAKDRHQGQFRLIYGNMTATKLCLNVSGELDPTGPPGLTVAMCEKGVPPHQNFAQVVQPPPPPSPAAFEEEGGVQLGGGIVGHMFVQVSTGLCITALGSESADVNRVLLKTCHTSQGRQYFILGTSGRFCADSLNNHCLKVDNGWKTAVMPSPKLDLKKW